MSTEVMNRGFERMTTLLVLENGADWPSWCREVRLRAPHSAVEVQMVSEPMEDFEARVEEALMRIAQGRKRLVAAGYACSVAEGRQQVRQRLCTMLLAMLSRDPRGELILAGGAWGTTGNEGKHRADLIHLWSKLSARTPGREMTVRFEDPSTGGGGLSAAEKLNGLTA